MYLSTTFNSGKSVLAHRLIQKLIARVIKVAVQEVEGLHIVCLMDYALDGKARTVS